MDIPEATVSTVGQSVHGQALRTLTRSQAWWIGDKSLGCHSDFAACEKNVRKRE